MEMDLSAIGLYRNNKLKLLMFKGIVYEVELISQYDYTERFSVNMCKSRLVMCKILECYDVRYI